MAKIDITSIPNFETLSADELREAIKGLEYDDHSAEVEKYKNSTSKANSEIAEMKRQLKEKMSEDERKAAEDKERWEELTSKLQAAEKREKIGKYTNEYLSMGYSSDLAQATAQAKAEGDDATVFANQRAFIEQYTQKVKADMLKQTPTPPAGAPSEGMTKEKFSKLSTTEQMTYMASNPDWKNLK